MAAKLATQKYPKSLLHVVYCDVRESEHPDQERFLLKVQDWIDHPIEIIKSTDYQSIDEVFERTRYMAGIYGARCTIEMKKIPRFRYQQADDIHLFGLTWDEEKRIERFTADHPDLYLDWILRDQQYKKEKCLQMVRLAGIDLPAMYKLGYKNNNCIGCVKATSAKYWNKIRKDFPGVFAKRAAQSRELGVRLTRVRGERVFLDELPADYLLGEEMENISCGPDCSKDEVSDNG